MKYGLIGEKLGHSFSKEIHERIGKYEYELVELNKEQFKTFMMERNFKAINVTMPYKKDVIEYLDFISEEAKKIDAVNTIVNKDGKLYGYNTDYYGLKEMLHYFNIDVTDKNIMILGTGGTSKTSYHVVNDLKAKSVTFVSRSEGITYEQVSEHSSDIDVLINTTPKEMYPNNSLEILNSLDSFTSLKGVVDVVYNPIRTNLTLKAKEKGINACNGLFMLIAQAVYAIDIFLDTTVDKSIIASLYEQMITEKENIVLIGMPGCGKTTIGKKLAMRLNMKLVDVDDEIIKEINMPIKDYFAKYGEQSFRDVESKVIEKLSKQNSLIISTGGGSILRKENVNLLKQNGKLFFLDRALKNLVTSNSRPLSSNFEDLKKRYEERYPLYNKVCDIRINCNCNKNIIANKIVMHKIAGGN